VAVREKQSYLDWLIGASLRNKAVTEGRTIKRGIAETEVQ